MVVQEMCETKTSSHVLHGRYMPTFSTVHSHNIAPNTSNFKSLIFYPKFPFLFLAPFDSNLIKVNNHWFLFSSALQISIRVFHDKIKLYI